MRFLSKFVSYFCSTTDVEYKSVESISIDRLHPNTKIQYYCSIVSISLYEVKKTKEYITVLENRLSMFDPDGNTYNALLKEISDLQSIARGYKKTANKYATKIPKEQYDIIVKHVNSE